MFPRVIIGLAAVLALSGAAAADDHTLPERLAAASLEKGEKTFKRCHACHTIEKGGAHGNGPNLWGVVGRPVASAADFRKYSDALRTTGGAWTTERIDTFLTDPHQDIKGTRMPFIGLDKPQARADLIAYLNGNSPAPFDFSVGAVPGGMPIEEEPPEYGFFAVAEGVDEAYAYCTACHSERLVAQQGLDRHDWIELLEWMVEEQSMAEIEEPDLSIVLDYLTTNYNIDRPNFPKN